MITQTQVSEKQNYGSCDSCRTTKQQAIDDKMQETCDKAIKIKVNSSHLSQPTTKGDPRLSSVLSKSAIVQKSWPPLTNKSGIKHSGDDDGSGDNKLKKTVLQKAADTIPCLGILLALGASIFLGSAGMLVKMTRSVHGIQVAVFR